MQSTLGKCGAADGSVDVVFSASDIAAAKKSAFDYFAKNARVNGFRKGHAPRNIVEQQYSADIQERAAEQLTREGYGNALKCLQDSNVRLASDFTLENAIDLSTEEPKITFTFLHAIDFADFDFSAVEVEWVESEVDDKAVDACLARLQDTRATLEDAKEDQVIDDTCVAYVDFVGKKDGEPFPNGSATDYKLDIKNAQMIPGFIDQIKGHKAGEKFEINCKFPEEYHAQELAGQDAVFDITVKSISVKKLPELNDEFAKLFDVEDLNTLRSSMASNLKLHVKEYLLRTNSNALFTAVAQKIGEFTPQSQFMEMATNSFINSFLRNMGFAGKLDKRLADLFKGMAKEHNAEITARARVDQVVRDLFGFVNISEEAIKAAVPELAKDNACLYEDADEYLKEAEKTDSDVYESLMNEASFQLLVNDLCSKVKLNRVNKDCLDLPLNGASAMLGQ